MVLGCGISRNGTRGRGAARGEEGKKLEGRNLGETRN